MHVRVHVHVVWAHMNNVYANTMQKFIGHTFSYTMCICVYVCTCTCTYYVLVLDVVR